jgi:hypothetical protein
MRFHGQHHTPNVASNRSAVLSMQGGVEAQMRSGR